MISTAALDAGLAMAERAPLPSSLNDLDRVTTGPGPDAAGHRGAADADARVALLAPACRALPRDDRSGVLREELGASSCGHRATRSSRAPELWPETTDVAASVTLKDLLEGDAPGEPRLTRRSVHQGALVSSTQTCTSRASPASSWPEPTPIRVRLGGDGPGIQPAGGRPTSMSRRLSEVEQQAVRDTLPDCCPACRRAGEYVVREHVAGEGAEFLRAVRARATCVWCRLNLWRRTTVNDSGTFTDWKAA